MVFSALSVYVLRNHFDSSWFWSIVAGIIIGLFAALILISPLENFLLAIKDIVNAKVDSLEKKIDDKLEIHHLKNSKETFVEIFLRFKKTEGDYRDIVGLQLRYIPRVGDKLYISELQEWGFRNKFWTSEEEFEEIRKLRPDIHSYEWRVEEVIWRPFKPKVTVLIILN